MQVSMNRNNKYKLTIILYMKHNVCFYPPKEDIYRQSSMIDFTVNPNIDRLFLLKSRH